MPKKKKPDRRRNGEGSIRQRKDGRWEYRYTVYDPITNEPDRKNIIKNDEQELLDIVYELQNKIRKGRYVDPGKETLWEWVYKYLHSFKKKEVERTTFDSYEITATTHLKGSIIADIPLGKLRTEDLQNYYNSLVEKIDKRHLECRGCKLKIIDTKTIDDLMKIEARSRHCPNCKDRLYIHKGIGIRTIHYLRTQIIGAALKKATEVVPKKIESNPNIGTTLPELVYKKTEPFTREEIMTIKTALKNDKHYAAIYTDMATGLRIGELLALKWSKLDLHNGTLTVDESVKKVRTEDPESSKKWELIDGDPKTKASKGEIPLSRKTKILLKIHLKNQKLLKRIYGTKYVDNDLVFCNDNGTQISPDNFRKHFKRLLKSVGIDNKRFHALRHSFGALLLEEGEELKVIQELLRHENIETTADIYIEVTDKLKKKAVSKMDAIL